MNRTDLADPAAGILATLDRHIPLAVFEHAGNGDCASLQVEQEPTPAAIELEGPLLGSWSVKACHLKGALVGGDGSKTKIDGLGAVTEASPTEPGRDPAVLRRSLVICFEEGDLLAIATAKPSGSPGHGAEEVRAAYSGSDGEHIDFTEPLLSTEYGPNGVQRRATLELWIGDHEGPIRGAGGILSSVTLELPGAESTLAFFEWSVDGRLGIGRYEIIRAT